MPLSTAQQLRLRIQDQPTLVDVTRYGDGTAVSFPVPHRNLVSGTAWVALGHTAWSATGATFDPTGQIVFSSVVPANSAFRLTYLRTTFSDDEIDH